MRATRYLPAVGLCVWATALSALGLQAMRGHLAPLPHPDPGGPAWAGAPPADGRWAALHVLKARCRCSDRILGHLAARGPEPGVRERVLWVGDGATGPTQAPPGYEVELLTAAELAARYDLRAAPMLVVLGPDGGLRYAGGYTARKQGPDPRDRDILARVRAGERVPALPVLGCPIDPATDNP